MKNKDVVVVIPPLTPALLDDPDDAANAGRVIIATTSKVATNFLYIFVFTLVHFFVFFYIILCTEMLLPII